MLNENGYYMRSRRACLFFLRGELHFCDGVEYQYPGMRAAVLSLAGTEVAELPTGIAPNGKEITLTARRMTDDVLVCLRACREIPEAELLAKIATLRRFHELPFTDNCFGNLFSGYVYDSQFSDEILAEVRGSGYVLEGDEEMGVETEFASDPLKSGGMSVPDLARRMIAARK